VSFGKFIGKLLGLEPETPDATSSRPVTAATPPATPDDGIEAFRAPSDEQISRAAVIRQAMTVHRAQQANLNSLTDEERRKLRSIAEQTFLDPGDGRTRH
jgi:uncharacterized membrane protein